MRLRIGIIISLLFLLIGFASILWTPYAVTNPDVTVSLQGPSVAHSFGADSLGRDILSLTMKGILTSFVVAAVAVAIGALLGVPLGWVAALGGWAEWAVTGITRFTGVFPALIVALLLATAFGPSIAVAMVAIGIANVPMLAEVARTSIRRLERSDFVAAGRLAGFAGWDLVRRHFLPDLLLAVGRIALQLLASGVLAEALLSFAGLGAQAPTSSLGLMLRDAQSYLASNPVAAVVPGLVLVIIAVSLGLVARHLGGGRGRA